MADISKGQFDQAIVESVVKMTNEVGIHIVTNFMFGLPEDTQESMEKTLEFARKLNPECINFFCVMAYLGSQLFQKIQAEHPEFLPDQWIGYAQYSYECKPRR